jgi:hypothetical protein
MHDDRSPSRPDPSTPGDPQPKTLPPAAQRALVEAAERRRQHEERLVELARTREINGRGGLDPVRYDDWEVKGIASDFS